MNRWYNVPDADKQIAYSQISEQTGLSAFAVEKDWWVVQTLAILFELEVGKHLVFKGGTSLSKGWSIIQRFSEDIDLAIDRSFYGFNGELGKNQRSKLRKKANAYITGTLFQEIKKKFHEKGLLKVTVELETITSSDQDPIIININYPYVISPPAYLQPRVQIEIGCRSLYEPFENRSIISLVDNAYPDTPFSQRPVQIPTVLVERTFLEKIFLLHEEFQRPVEKRRVHRLSRHLYDIHQIAKTEYAHKALSNKNLYDTIVKHRDSFTHLGGVDYTLHAKETVSFIPPEELISAWEADYKTMQEEMIYGDSPGFGDLVKSLRLLNQKINNGNEKPDEKA